MSTSSTKKYNQNQLAQINLNPQIYLKIKWKKDPKSQCIRCVPLILKEEGTAYKYK